MRRAQIGAPELVLRRHLALDIFANLTVGFAQFLGDVAAELLIDLNDLQLGLDNLALRLGGGSDKLAAFALQTRGFAFERRQPVDLHQVLRPQIPHALEFLIDQGNLLGLGVLLRGEAGDLLVQLFDTLLQLVFLPRAGLCAAARTVCARFQALPLRRDRQPGRRVLWVRGLNSAPSRSAASRARRA